MHRHNGTITRPDRAPRRMALAPIAMTLALLSCYGVLGLTVLLPLVGLRLALDPVAWSASIVLFTSLTVLSLLPGYRHHYSIVPGLCGLAGGGLILYALLVHYQALIELAGFVLLTLAVIHDSHLRRRGRANPISAQPD